MQHHHESLSDYFKNQDLFTILKELKNRGYQALVVGGAVRDALLGIKPYDYDIVTDASVQEIQRLFPKTLAVGAQFGVLIVFAGKSQFEVAQFREESDYQDGRRPLLVKPGTIQTDAKRRDFTMNALFYDPITGYLFDEEGGLRDIKAKIIRCVGNPSVRFQEDHLRILRALRFQVQLGFQIEEKTRQAISDNIELATKVSNERIIAELSKVFESDKLFNYTLDRIWVTFFIHWLELPMVSNLKESVEFTPQKHLKSLQDLGGWPCVVTYYLFRLGFNLLEVEKKWIPKILKKESKHRTRDFIKGLNFESWINTSLGEKLVLSTNPFTRLGMLVSELKEVKELTLYWENWAINSEGAIKPPQPILQGADLVKRGMVPGPQIKKILEQAYRVQLEYKLKDSESLLDHLIKTGYIL
jgi:tRNA nucleotidyltransferase/poly(A) polymerase